MAVIFDTLALAQKLRDKAKFTPEQAEGAAEAFAEAMSEQVATKADIDRPEVQLVMLKWMVGVTIAGVAALVVKAFF